MADFGEIIPFGEQDRQLLRLNGAQLDVVRSGELLGPEEPYLATDVYQGEFGVDSYALVIPRPQERPFYYMAEEGPAGVYDEERVDYRVGDDPVRRAHFLNTEQGFAIERTVVAPTDVIERLRTDKFLGPALIDKACLEGTVSPKLDEEYELGAHDSFGYTTDELLRPVRQRILDRLETATGTKYEIMRLYPSWHSHRVYGSVLGEISQACQATVTNFDEILAILSRDMPRLHRFDDPQFALGQVALALPPAEAE